MIEERFARLRTHRSNVQRYRQLLETELTDFERQFIERRVTEEQSAIDSLAKVAVSHIFKDRVGSPDADPRAV